VRGLVRRENQLLAAGYINLQEEKEDGLDVQCVSFVRLLLNRILEARR